MYTEEEYLLLSGIQHFGFCRRQWAIIHIENQWRENELTVGGRFVHERVHDSSLTEKRGDTLIVRGLPIKSEQMGVVGECDAVVFTKSENGICLHGRPGLWSVMPVEYKHGRSKADDCDRLQAAAQAMCLEEMFCCAVPKAALFYHETRSREYIELTAELRRKVVCSFSEMHDLFRRKYTPIVKNGSYCARCSVKDLCLPRILHVGRNVDSYISEHIKEGKI